jgi:hypothetical protein
MTGVFTEGVRGLGGMRADCDGETVALAAAALNPNSEGGRRFLVEVGKLVVLLHTLLSFSVVGLSKNCTGRLGRRGPHVLSGCEMLGPSSEATVMLVVPTNSSRLVH